MMVFTRENCKVCDLCPGIQLSRGRCSSTVEHVINVTSQSDHCDVIWLRAALTEAEPIEKEDKVLLPSVTVKPSDQRQGGKKEENEEGGVRSERRDF